MISTLTTLNSVFPKKRYKKRSKGVPAGYKEDWAYKGHWGEKKLKRGLWKFKFKATKKRRAGTYGGFGKGTKGAWRIKGVQYITKTGKGKYQTTMIGTKRPIYFNVRKPKRLYSKSNLRRTSPRNRRHY